MLYSQIQMLLVGPSFIQTLLLFTAFGHSVYFGTPLLSEHRFEFLEPFDLRIVRGQPCCHQGIKGESDLSQ